MSGLVVSTGWSQSVNDPVQSFKSGLASLDLNFSIFQVSTGSHPPKTSPRLQPEKKSQSTTGVNMEFPTSTHRNNSEARFARLSARILLNRPFGQIILSGLIRIDKKISGGLIHPNNEMVISSRFARPIIKRYGSRPIQKIG